MLDHLDLKKARWRISPISGTINENWLSAFAPSQFYSRRLIYWNNAFCSDFSLCMKSSVKRRT